VPRVRAGIAICQVVQPLSRGPLSLWNGRASRAVLGEPVRVREFMAERGVNSSCKEESLEDPPIESTLCRGLFRREMGLLILQVQ
jgi:hypothetical protein